MTEQLTVAERQRCGRGFLLTPTYRDWLARRGVEVVQPLLCPTCFSKTGPVPKQHGQVKWLSPHKHYGFTSGEEGDEIFFHERPIVRDDGEPYKGQRVRFHVEYAERGPEALNVELVGE
jgi:cold shock CspA family protein